MHTSSIYSWTSFFRNTYWKCPFNLRLNLQTILCTSKKFLNWIPSRQFWQHLPPEYCKSSHACLTEWVVSDLEEWFKFKYVYVVMGNWQSTLKRDVILQPLLYWVLWWFASGIWSLMFSRERSKVSYQLVLLEPTDTRVSYSIFLVSLVLWKWNVQLLLLNINRTSTRFYTPLANINEFKCDNAHELEK